MLKNARMHKAPNNTELYTFNSLQQYNRWLLADLPTRYNDCDTWSTGFSSKEAAREKLDALTAAGDLAAVPKAEKLLEQFSAAIERDLCQWELSQVGAFPAVAEYLSGEPLSMYQQVHVADDRAPVRIVVNTTMSAGIDHSTILKRGIAALALVLKLSEIRPVTLSLLNSGSNKGRKGAQGILVDVCTTPLDLAHVSFAICSTAWTRAIGYEVFKQHEISEGRDGGWDGGWPWNIHPEGSGAAEHEKRMREALGMAEEDIYLPPMHLQSPEVKNPTKFIQDAIKKYLPD